EWFVEPNECLALSIVEIESVWDCDWVVAVANQNSLCVLVGGRHFQFAADAQEYGLRVIGQAIGEMRPEGGEIEPITGNDRRHARPPFGARNGDAVHVGFLDSGKRTDRCRYLGGGDVFALPSERIADAIDEIEVAALVPTHEIAGPNPRVARLEHVAQELFLRGLVVCVALEPASNVRLVPQKLANRFAYLVWRTMHAESARIAHRRVGLRVVFHKGRGKSMRQKRRDVADGARHAFDIHER